MLQNFYLRRLFNCFRNHCLTYWTHSKVQAKQNEQRVLRWQRIRMGRPLSPLQISSKDHLNAEQLPQSNMKMIMMKMMLNITHYQRNANQNHKEVLFTLVRMAAIKMSTNNKCWRGCGEKGTLLHCWWEWLVQPLWRTVWRFLKKLEIELSYNPEIPLLGMHTEETKIERDVYPNVHRSNGHWRNIDVHQQMSG